MLGAVLLASLHLGAHAAPEPTSEEVIVFGDPFRRWEDTRWFIAYELTVPMGLVLARDANKGFHTHALQVRAVVHCNKDAPLGKRKYEVGCSIEDIGIQASERHDTTRPRQMETVKEVLDEIDGKLTGASVQLQVKDDGGVPNVDLEGIEADNRRERAIQESLRQMVLRIAMGFDMELPQPIKDKQWIEYKNPILSMPSATASQGSTQVVSTMVKHKGNWIVQQAGRAIVTTSMPNAMANRGTLREMPDLNAESPSQLSGGGLGGGGGDAQESLGAGNDNSGIDFTVEPEKTLGELIYELNLTGVAVFDPETGILTERVWGIEGTTTGSGLISAQSAPPFYYNGRIRMLGTTEAPSCGPTRQISSPTRAVEGLPAWVSIESS